MAYDLATLTVSYSAITQPAPTLRQGSDGAHDVAAVPLALGARWLAHASNQVFQGFLPSHGESQRLLSSAYLASDESIPGISRNTMNQQQIYLLVVSS